MEVDSEFKYTVQNPSLHRARVIAERVLELYNKRELDEIYVIYTKMENSVSMVTEKMRLLPCYREQFEKNRPPIDMYQEEIKTDTSVKEVLEHIVPNCVKVSFTEH